MKGRKEEDKEGEKKRYERLRETVTSKQAERDRDR